MHFEMSHRQLLKTGSARKTCHMVFGNALPPMDWCCWCLWCCHSNDTIRVFLRLQCEKTTIGLLKGCMHVLWGEFLRLNLCKNQVFRHFEEGLRHERFLSRCREETQSLFCSQKCVLDYKYLLALSSR